MLKFLKKYYYKKTVKRIINETKQEIDGNLELYYVMTQLGELRIFSLEKYYKAENYIDKEKEKGICLYVEKLNIYNNSCSEYIKYQDWYSSEIKNKTRENAVILHEKREKAQSMLDGIEKIIKDALDSISSVKFNEFHDESF